MNNYPGKEDQNPKPVSDAELVLAAWRDDKKAFIEIVARHQAMVCGIALGILGDFAASEDAGQEAFLTAWRKIHDLREPDRLRPWLCQIARNAALGQLRSKRVHEPLSDDLGLADEHPTPDETTAAQEEAELVRRSLALLPETYRLPLILYYREDRSVRAVAEALGLSEDAVKQRLSRGREMCREKIGALLETVLTRSRPSTIFTMSVAVAIGALAAPAVVAGTAFAAASSARTASTASAFKTLFSTAMTSSKAFLVTTAVIGIVCVPIGYHLQVSGSLPARRPITATISPQKSTTNHGLNLVDSALVAQWRALHEKYGTNSAAMPVLYKAIHDLKDPFDRSALNCALISEWAQVDPKSGLRFFMDTHHDRNEREQFFREWFAEEPQTALAALRSSGSGWEGVARACLKDIARSTPDQLASVVEQLPKPESYWDSTVRDAFEVLAQNGMVPARAAAEGLSGPNRDQALAGVASVWAKTDLDAVISWAKSLPEGTDKNEIIRTALVGKASVDPIGALDSLGVVPEGGRQSFFGSTTGARVLSAAAQADFDATVAWLTSHPGRLSSQDLEGLASIVTDKLNSDPTGFLSAHAADGSLKVLMPAISSALLNNSGGERGMVWDWLKAQQLSPEIKSLQDQVLSSAAWQDPEFAMQLVSDIPKTPDGDHQVQDLAQRLFNGGSMLGRFDQLMSMAPQRLQAPLAEAAFNTLRQDNLGNPQVWSTRLALLPQSDQAQGASSLGHAWAQQAPADALAWANSLQQPDSRSAAIAAIASGWAEKDPSGAAAWLNTLPPGSERDKSAASLVAVIAERQPSEAWNWALSIQDATERNDAASRVIQWMAKRDPTTASQWIQSASLSAQDQQSLLAMLQKPALHN